VMAAVASSMGVRTEILVEVTDVEGEGEADFEDLMKARAAAFGRADKNGDGTLDFDEFANMVRFRETTKYSDKELRDKFRMLDADGSGKADAAEFILFSLKESLQRSKGKAIDVFRAWDADNSGTIDRDEFGKAILSLGFVCSARDLDAVFGHFDKDNSGRLGKKELQMLLLSMGEETDPGQMMSGESIDFNTFLQIRQDKWAKEQSGEEVKAAFQVFDAMGSGTISAEDLKRIMTTMGEKLTPQEADEMVRDAGGGQIDYSSFVDKMKRKT